jgi:dUTP pyrophosphatase
MPELKIYKMCEDVQLPSFATTESACFDIKCFFHRSTVTAYTAQNTKIELPIRNEKFYFPSGYRALVPTGLILDIPFGYSVRIHPRSGISLKFGLTLINSEGIIDCDYTEELMIPLHNTSGSFVDICHGDRIAQGEVVESMRYIEFIEIKERPSQKTNRTGGFGSTGVS